MRIIAGTLKGRRLRTPTWEGLRPTSDRLRETLFNVIAGAVGGARFLDGYAGTGAVGIEALSRGAAHVTFVERDRRAVTLIEANLQLCRVTDRYAIIRAGLVEAAATLEYGGFDVVFLDPPYGVDQMQAGLAASAGLVTVGGLLILEHARRDDVPAASDGLERTRTLPSGDSALTFYRAVTP